MTAFIDRDGDDIVIDVPVTDNPRVKLVPGATFDRARRAWRTPLSWAACVQLRGVFEDELVVGPALTAWAVEEHETRIARALEARDEGWS